MTVSLGSLVATISVLGAALFAFGALLWLQAPGDKNLDEVGRAIMLGVFLAVAVGIPQYLLDQREKDRDFNLSLSLQQNLTGANLYEKDLSDILLQGKVLAQANLRDAELEGARLVGTNLKGADLRGANLQDADLRGARLDGASLDGADLTGARLKDAYLIKASLPDANLAGAQLQSANLSGACLAGAQLQDADLGGVKLAGAVLTGADVDGAKFESDLRPTLGLHAAGLADLENPTEATWPREFEPPSTVEPRHAEFRALPPPRHGTRFTAMVVNVSDGDTLRLQSEQANMGGLPDSGHAALIGVNAPDPDDTDGPAATGFLKRSLVGQRVHVQVGGDGTDDGGRGLVYIWRSGEKTFNEMVLEAGHATYRADSDKAMTRRLHAAETNAKQQGAGLWEECPTPEERIAPEGVEIRTT